MTLSPHSPADVLRWLMIGLAVVTDPSLRLQWPCYVASEPSEPDEAITTYDTANAAGRELVTGGFIGHYGVQIRCRSKDHPRGWMKIAAIAQALSVVHMRSILIGTEAYLVEAVSRYSRPLALGKEAGTSKRHIFTLNASLSARHL